VEQRVYHHFIDADTKELIGGIGSYFLLGTQVVISTGRIRIDGSLDAETITFQHVVRKAENDDPYRASPRY
jgi:hypothetical protein